jgi:hypothetical protein
MDDQNDLLEDPEVGINLPDLNQDVDVEFAIPQDEDEQLGNLPFAGSAVGSAGWNLAGQGPHRRVPSHVSVASNASHATSIVATSSYFGTTQRSPAEINARQVICPKNARGVLGSCDYSRHQEAATKALPHIFASAKHFHAKNSEGEASNKYANLQSEYAGNLAKIKNFKRHMDSWDMSDPFIIPELINPSALSVEDRWAERKTTGVHLLKNWGKLSLCQCKAWQRGSFDYASIEDLTSMEWAKSLMMNSCDALIAERIDEKFEDLALYEQGSRLHLMKCSPSATLLSLPSRDSLRTLLKKALPRSPTRMFIWLPNRSLQSLNDWLKYLLYQLNVQFKYWKGSPNVPLTSSGKLLATCWSVNA